MKKSWMVLVAALGLSIAGCHVGMAPEPMRASDVKGEVEKLSPEQQIDWYQRSPMPPAEKQAKINEIKRKAGMPVDEGAAGAPGAPAVPGASNGAPAAPNTQPPGQ